MKTWTRLVGALVLSGCASSGSMRQDEVPNELRTVMPVMQQVWRGTDAAAFQPLYADGVKVETAEDRYTGWNEVRARWLSEWPKIRNFTTSDHRFTRKGTDITESGHYEYQLVKDDGSTSKRNGTYVQRWELQSDGNYRVSAFTLQ